MGQVAMSPRHRPNPPQPSPSAKGGPYYFHRGRWEYLGSGGEVKRPKRLRENSRLLPETEQTLLSHPREDGCADLDPAYPGLVSLGS